MRSVALVSAVDDGGAAQDAEEVREIGGRERESQKGQEVPGPGGCGDRDVPAGLGSQPQLGFSAACLQHLLATRC